MSITVRAVRGAAWNMGTGVGARILQLVGTVVLTRFVAPDQFGEVSAAAVCVLTANQLTAFAIGQYLIARRSPPEVVFQAAEIHLGTGFIAMAVVVLLARPLGAMVDAPGMATFIPGFALANLLDRARYVPERLLTRDLRFRTLAMVNASGELTYTAVALALAVAMGWGGHAIVVANIARALLTCTLILRLAPRSEWWAPTRLRLKTARELLGYGTPIMLGALSDVAATRWDNLIVARLFGPAVLGHYTLAYSLAELPVSYIAKHMSDVLLPSFSQANPSRQRAAVARSAGLMMLVVAPLGVGLGAVAPTLVAAFLDARWAPIAPLLATLSVVTVLRPATWPTSAFLQAQQRPMLIMVASFVKAPVLLSLVALLGMWGGPVWSCAAPGIAYILSTSVMVLLAAKGEGLPAGDYLLALVRPLAACAPMYAAVSAVRTFCLAQGLGHVPSLILQVVAGTAVYAGAAFLLARPLVIDLIHTLRHSLARRRPEVGLNGGGA